MQEIEAFRLFCFFSIRDSNSDMFRAFFSSFKTDPNPNEIWERKLSLLEIQTVSVVTFLLRIVDV